ncbi:hypothetical protein PybrP1_011779 [[Pythium] brassicae (nom. inval.)]|nr:hypothetical protein PybrP1_011779 [[Pythium] brassicae (nom. inval.)]
MAPVGASLGWLLLLSMHGATASFFGANAVFYHWLRGTDFDHILQSNEIVMSSKWHPTIAALMGLIALPHALMFTKMLIASLATRSFAYSYRVGASDMGDRYPSVTWLHRVVSLESFRQSLSKKPSCTSKVVPAWHHGFPSAKAWVTSWREKLFGREGLLGADSRYLVRELVELSLQTTQAYRMSCYLPRTMPKHVYAGLLVTNCWMTPIIYAVTKKNETRRQLLRLSCDCALDFATSVLIPCVILKRYVAQFDRELQSFDAVLWMDKIWFANFVFEVQILLVASWGDLGMRFMFSLGMLLSMSSIKRLVEAPNAEASSNQVSPHAVTAPPTASIVPVEPSRRRSTSEVNKGRTAPCSDDLKRELSAAQHDDPAPQIPITFRHSGRVGRLVHSLLVLWGAIILGIHLHAELIPTLRQCLFQLHPWGKAKATCTLVDFDCHDLKISGSPSEMEVAWYILDLGVVEDLLIRHCSALAVPSSLRTMSQLTTLEFYNTTISVWDESAALTAADHPYLMSLYFVRVNLTDGELPAGVLSPDFPQTATSVMACVTNLRSLPPDLDTKWPRMEELYLERSAFEEVPAVITRLRPTTLSLFGNPLRELPAALFESEWTQLLYIGSTLISTLPAFADTTTSSLDFLYMTNTQVSSFPAWFDGFVSRWRSKGRYRPLLAGATPYCSQLREILNGSRADFATAEDGMDEISVARSVLMNMSAENQELVTSVVSCLSAKYPWYWLSNDDENFALEGSIEEEGEGEDGSPDIGISVMT